MPRLSFTPRPRTALLLAALSTTAWAAAAQVKPEAAPVAQLVTEATRGELSEARADLAKLSKHRALGPAAQLYLRAALELAGPTPRKALPLCAKLVRAAPHAPEAVVLSALASQRALMPDRSWVDALADAWKGAGRPTLEDSGLLPVKPSALEPVSKPPREELHGLAAELLLPYATGEAEEVLAELALSTATKDAMLETKLVALNVLGSSRLPLDFRHPAKQARTRLLRELTESFPDQMYLALWALVENTDETARLTTHELKQLEQIAQKPANDYPVAKLYQAFLTAVQSVDPAQAEERAYLATVQALPAHFVLVLFQRAEQTAQEGTTDERHRLAQALATAGMRFSSGKSLFELSLGLAMMERAQKLDDTLLLPNEFYARRGVFRDLSATSGKIEPFLHLPIRPLQREVLQLKATDELALLRRFSR